MNTDFKTLSRRLTGRTTELDKVIEEHAKYGLKIIPVGNIGRPAGLRKKLGMKPGEYGVTAFMASSPGKLPEMAEIKEIVRGIPTVLTEINRDHNLGLRLISGGGRFPDEGPNETTGLMGEWAWGATRNGHIGLFVTTQGLAIYEGLAHAQGIAVCLKQEGTAYDSRLGLRTDGLAYAGDLDIIFPGGTGTKVEMLVDLTNVAITPDLAHKRYLLIDPVVTNPVTGASSNFWAPDIRSMIEKNQFGYVSDKTAHKINESCLVLRQDPSLTPEQKIREAVGVVLAIRDAASQFNPEANYAPVPQDLLREFLQPLARGSSIGRIFDNHPLQDRSWGDSLHYLATAHRNGNKAASSLHL